MNYIKKNKIYFINITTCILLFLLTLYLNNIFPFGKEIIGKSDTLSQFKPMLYNFIMKIKTGTLLSYTFNNGLGNATIFDYIYYLSSPINLIAILFKNPNTMYLIVILIKIIITSLTITKYTKSKTNNNSYIFICSLSYVFSGWFLTYYHFAPWLDIFMIFPLFQYGLEELLNKNKYHIYIFTLSYMLITNFYLCFSICIYTILYFIIYEILYKKSKEKLKKFKYISLSTLVAFLLSFLYLYILYDIMKKTSLQIDNHLVNNYTVNILDLIKSLFYGNNIFTYEMFGNTFPNINCSILLLFPFIHFFINKNINKRIKIYSFIALIIIILTILIPEIDFIFNGFHSIRGFTYRYSFIITFLYIKLILYDLINTKVINIKEYIISFIIITILYIISFKHIIPSIRIFNITFIISYIIYIFLYNKNKYYKYILFISFLLELLISTYINIPDNVKAQELKPNYRINNVKYRLSEMNVIPEYDNANLYTNSKVTYVFSSITYGQVIDLFKNIGCETLSNSYGKCYPKQDIVNLLLNVKSNNNPFYLEKIYSVNKNIKKTNLKDIDIKYNLETIIHNMTNINTDNLFIKEVLTGTKEDNIYVFNTNHENFLIEVKKEGEKTKIKSLNYKKFVHNTNNTATIYVLNRSRLKDIYNYLSKNQIKYSYYNDNHIKGTINVDKDQLIFTSIPYDKDWEVLLDGKKIKTIKLLNSLLGIETTKGKHTIELTYKTHYLIPALVSIITFILLIIDIIKKRKQ